MAYFDEHIGIEHGSRCLLHALGTVVVMQQVLGDAGSLGFPVQPDPHDVVVDMIAADDDIDPCMELDACGLCAA